VEDLPVEQVGDGGQTDMGVGPNVDAIPGREIGGPHLVEEDKRADGFSHRRGQDAADAESAEVLAATLDQQLDRTLAGGARRFVRFGPAHDAISLKLPSNAISSRAFRGEGVSRSR